GVAASTAGQVHGVLGAKGLTHRTSAGPARVLVAALADHQDAGGLAGGTPLDQFEGVFPRLGGLPLVGEVDPGEVVDVSGRACHDEAGGDGGGAFVALAPAPVHVSGLVGAVGVGEQVEGAGVGGGQPVALGASQPSWERGHRYTDAGPFVVHVGGGGDVWRGTQLLDLGSELATDGGEEAVLFQGEGVGALPCVQPTDHHRQVRQVDHGTDAEGVQELAGAQLADADGGVHHCASFWSSPVSPWGWKGWWASSPRSSVGSRIRRIPGSTSRSEVGQVVRDHLPSSGWRISPTSSFVLLV